MSKVIWFLQVLSLGIKTIFCWNCIDAAAPVQMQDFVLWWFVILRISFQEACPCHLRIIFLDCFHDSGLNATAKCLILLYLKCSVSFAGYYFPLQPVILPYLKSQSLIMYPLFFFPHIFVNLVPLFLSHMCLFVFCMPLACEGYLGSCWGLAMFFSQEWMAIFSSPGAKQLNQLKNNTAKRGMVFCWLSYPC